MSHRVSLLLLLAFACSAAGPAHATQIVLGFDATLDGWVRDFPKGGAWDIVDITSTSAAVGEGTFFGSSTRGLLEIDLSSVLSSGVTITAAVLRLDGFVTGVNQAENLTVEGYVGDGALTLADATVAATVQSTVSYLPTGTAGFFTIDPALLQAALGSTGYAGFRMRDLNNNFAGVAIWLSESGATAPSLTIDYIPEPASGLLLGAGLAMLSLRRRVPRR